MEAHPRGRGPVLRRAQHGELELREAHSLWTASAIFAPSNGAKVEKALREEIVRALKDGFTAQELSEGQRGLLNYRRLARAGTPASPRRWRTTSTSGAATPIRRRSTRPSPRSRWLQVNAALRKYIRPEDFALVLAGDFSSLERAALVRVCRGSARRRRPRVRGSRPRARELRV